MVSVIEPRAASVAFFRSVAVVFGGAVNTARNRPPGFLVTWAAGQVFPWSKDTCARVDAMRAGGASWAGRHGCSRGTVRSLPTGCAVFPAVREVLLPGIHRKVTAQRVGSAV